MNIGQESYKPAEPTYLDTSVDLLKHNFTFTTGMLEISSWVPVPENATDVETLWRPAITVVLLSLLVTICFSLPKLHLAWRILNTSNQVGLFNQAVALSLATSGEFNEPETIWFYNILNQTQYSRDCFTNVL